MRAQSPDAFATSLLKAVNDARVRTIRTVNKSARAIKEQARENVNKSAPVHGAAAAKTITYDDAALLPDGSISSEIGYSRRFRAARIGNLLEYGGGGDRSPAHRDLGRAADAEEQRFADAMQAMAWKLL